MSLPTLHLTNWSSTKLHGPGRKWTIMAAPRKWEHGDGRLLDFVPPFGLLREVKTGIVTEGYYFLELRRRWMRDVDDMVRTLGCNPHAPGALIVGEEEVADGDSLLCACAVGKPCHRREVAPFLVRAGWNVMLDGVRFELKETPQ